MSYWSGGGGDRKEGHVGVASQVPWIICLESSLPFLPCLLWPHLSKDVAAFTVHYEKA